MSDTEADLDGLGEALDDDVGRDEPAGADFSDRLVRRFLRLCENPITRDRMLRMVQASVSDARSAQRFYSFLNNRMGGLVGRRRRVQISTSRMELIGSQLMGMAMLRYVLKVEPIASMSIDELAPMVAAGVRGVLRSQPGVLAAEAAPVEGNPAEALLPYKATGRPL
ncbi:MULTISPECIES: hypothetical protein [unclassified Nocardioides]|uniref:TetR/AcrR family transcriptional regulator n=1 Tax=unclassified Nocardioides TaxID=2615069 RepID=UPI0006FA00D1|nr:MULTISPECIES: hypothetical protein [unclassified Nocardioides]KQY64303.1 hypothetical protein ASD30_05000 [Nocardioides sp. Root140]KQZ70222.1 hypothetical protein ASD66_11275 [Nocardioides sp. Root151]KRF16319.1 hypothetical protein ASH02_07025 [Nocardioides sp. Soil796]